MVDTAQATLISHPIDDYDDDDDGSWPEQEENVQTAPNLLSLPTSVLASVLGHLQPSEVARSATTCTALQRAALELARSGLVLPLVPSLQAQSTGPSGILDWSEFPLIQKTPRPGFGTWMGAQPANTCSTLWQVRLETLRGVRLEVGLGTIDSLKIGVMARNKTWLFDCWGRRVHGNDASSYGGMMREGDVIGILYEREADTLTFLQNGVSMGPAFAGLSGKHERRLLYPVIHFPFFPLDTVRIMQPGAEDVASAIQDAQSCCVGDDNDTMQWEAPPHPDDGKLIIETRCHYVNYRIAVDPMQQTVGSLKQALASGVERGATVAYGPEDCEFLFGGATFPNDTPLSECGVKMDPASRTHLTRIQLYFPVEVS